MADALTPPLDAADHVAGPADAPLELVMFGDFQCPYCAAAQGPVRRVRERLEGRLRFAFRHLPIVEVHPDAQRAAEASEAAAAQESFWAMHDALYAARGQLSPADLIRHAGGLSLDTRRLGAELDAGTHAARVARDVASGAASGVAGTPTFFINGLRHADAFDARTLIDALAARA